MKSPSLSVVQFYYNSSRLDKSKTLLFLTHTLKRVQSIDIIHSDVWGMTLVIFYANYKYFVTFIGDYSRFIWIYFLCSNEEVFFFVFKLFHEHNQT
jgi:hypothetical protein